MLTSWAISNNFVFKYNGKLVDTGEYKCGWGLFKKSHLNFSCKNKLGQEVLSGEEVLRYRYACSFPHLKRLSVTGASLWVCECSGYYGIILAMGLCDVLLKTCWCPSGQNVSDSTCFQWRWPRTSHKLRSFQRWAHKWRVDHDPGGSQQTKMIKSLQQTPACPGQ